MNKKRKYIIILFLLLLSLSVGFALLQANLKINGSSKIQGSSWDIHFENLNISEGSVSLSTGDVAASIQSSRTDITYTVALNTPGDYYEFTVDAVNTGTVDGMVESVTSKLNNEPITTLPSYLNYSVTYLTNDDIGVNHLLKAGDFETYKVRVEYKRDINNTDMPTTVQTLSLSFGVIYVQADSNGVEVEHPLNRIVYTFNKFDPRLPNSNGIWYNEEYPIAIPYFETPSDALNSLTSSGYNLPFYLKHKVENGIVKEQYVEFVITEEMSQVNPGMTVGTYSIRGEKTKENNGPYLVPDDYISVFYESNKEAMKEAFGYSTNPSRCSETGTGNTTEFCCNVTDFEVCTDVGGYVVAKKNSRQNCYVSRVGNANCLLQ